ncbi:crotonase/enoyl-CoA hydratase family protein [Nocardioides sp.]|uniref:crotonase/enoyl-CoA hydratase family protein n=1 Tax=Nocardioides sp. TaxID=35761 RepID=UPI003D133EFD
MPVVITEKCGEIGVITLNRPEVRNALNTETRTAMRAALDAFDADRDVLAVVLTGAGGTFCSGRDLKAAAAGEPIYPNRAAALGSFNRRSIAKPVIAAVEGWVLAGGFELALSCDLIVAGQDAKFGLPEVTRNLVAIGGGLLRLPRRMPYHVAMEMALTGETWGAESLARWGVVNRVVPTGNALEAAVALGEKVAANGPSAVRAAKEIIRTAFDAVPEEHAFDMQMASAEPALSSPDGVEGIRAFAEKRRPVWSDR